MGRRRKTNKHLPQRVVLKHGRYYFLKPVIKDGKHTSKWIDLGKDEASMYRKWADLAVPVRRASTMDEVFDQFLLEVTPTRSEHTQNDDKRGVKPLRTFFGKMSPDAIQPHHIYEYLAERGKKAKVRANISLLVSLG